MARVHARLDFPRPGRRRLLALRQALLGDVILAEVLPVNSGMLK